MALHPFQTFRKNRRTLMAGLVIMCMFIFILQFGKGDPLDQMMTFFGAGRSRTTDVATVYGKKVTDADLDALRKQRELANTIVESMTGTARAVLLGDMSLPNGLDEFDETQKILLRTSIDGQRRRFEMDRLSARFNLGAQFFAQQKAQASRDHEQLQLMEESLLEKNEMERARKVRQVRASLEYEMWLRERPLTERLYFGGSLRVPDLLDFVMWRNIADKLGITLTQADIRADVNREAFNYQPLAEDATAALLHVQRMFRNPPPNLTIDDVYTALGDELRVYLAQSAVLGQPPGARYHRYPGTDVNDVPATATPNEFWTYYQDNRTTLRVEMMPIKVADFLAKVGAPPSDADQALQDLFNRYKENEYRPQRDEPAFHEPQRVAIEWVGARPDSPHLRKQADQFILSMLALTPANPFLALDLTTRILETYESSKAVNYAMPDLLEGSFELSFFRDVTKPADVAGVLGQAMGTIAIGGNPASVRALYLAGVYARSHPAAAVEVTRELQRRAGVYATLVLAGQNPWTAAGMLAYASQAKQTLPLELVKKDVMEKVRDDVARRLMQENMTTVRTELEKLKGKPEEERKKAANHYLAKATTQYGLAHGTTESPRDFFSMAEDKGLRSLREAFGLGQARSTMLDYNFAAHFFGPAALYLPEQLPSGQEFLYWKTEDKKAYTPTYEEAKPKVIEAWRSQKARELARQEAERIQQAVAKVKNAGDGVKLLREESAKHPAWGEMFAVSNIARLVPENQLPGVPGYVPFLGSIYKPDDTRITPRPDFVDQLMRSLKEPGEATIVWNQPETIYYVTLLMDVGRPSEMTFYRDYSRPRAPGDTLWQTMEVERRKKYYQATMEQLRAEAGAPKGKWNVADDVRKRIEGRESSSEE